MSVKSHPPVCEACRTLRYRIHLAKMRTDPQAFRRLDDDLGFHYVVAHGFQK